MFRSALSLILAHPALGHALVALGLMALAVPLLRACGVRSAAWGAAVGVSTFFYGREAEEAERFLKPIAGDPAAFFMAFWPGNWNGGGADLLEWLAPTTTVVTVALLASRRAASGRELALPSRRPRA